VAGNDGPGILDPETSFEQRFEQIAGLSEDTDEHCGQQGIPEAQLVEKTELGDHSAADAAGQPPQRPLDALLGADERVEPVFPEGAAGVVGGRIIGHDDQHEDQEPLTAVGRLTQHDQVHQQKRDVQKCQHPIGDIPGGTGHIPDTEEEQEGKSQEQEGNPCQGMAAIAEKGGKNKRCSACCRRPSLNAFVRKGHPVELVNTDKDEDGHQAGEQQRTPLDNGQKQDRQKDKR